MELSLLRFLLFAGVPLALGCALLRSLGIGPRTDPVAYGGWAWLAGALALAGLETLRLLVGLGSPAAPAGLGLLAAAVLWRGARRTPLVAAEPGRAGALERGFFGLALLLALVALLHLALASSLTVVHANDEANFWSLRAKLLHEAQGFDGAYAQDVRTGALPNASYPLLNSLLQLWVFDCAGGITHAANRFPIQLCVLALVLCAAAAFRRASRPWVAGVLVLALASSAPVGVAVRQANSDALVGLGALVAADAWQRAQGPGRRAWLGLVALAVAFLLAAKREGTLLVLVAALASVPGAGWRAAPGQGWTLFRSAWPRSAVPLVAWLGTQLHNLLLGARGSHMLTPGVLAGLWANLGDLPDALAFLADLGTRTSLSAIPLVFALLALLVWPRPSGALAWVPLACLGFLLALVVALVHGGKTDYLLRTAAARVVFQLLPLAMLWIASLAPELLACLRPRGQAAQGSGRAGP